MEPSENDILEAERMLWEQQHEADFNMQMEIEAQMEAKASEMLYMQEEARRVDEATAQDSALRKRKIGESDNDSPCTANISPITSKTGITSGPNTITPLKRTKSRDNRERGETKRPRNTSTGDVKSTTDRSNNACGTTNGTVSDRVNAMKGLQTPTEERPEHNRKSAKDWRKNLFGKNSSGGFSLMGSGCNSTIPCTPIHTVGPDISHEHGIISTDNLMDQIPSHPKATSTTKQHSSTCLSVTTYRPKHDHMELRSLDGAKVFYVKKRDKCSTHNARSHSQPKPRANLLGVSIHEIMDQIDNDRMKSALAESKRASDAFQSAFNDDDAANDSKQVIQPEACDQLWVNKYSPKSYIELLSDEGVNREAIRWLKAWDHCVFNVKVPEAITKYISSNRFNPKSSASHLPTTAQRVWTSNTSYDPQVYETKRVMGPVELLVKDPLVRPFNKVLLLVGPPGLGKTTLAHIIAAQCGYSAIEMNASDDRAPEVFKAKLETVLNIQSISFGDNRPKCLIVDEIDGAHAGAVKALILRLQEAPQTKKRKKSKTKGHLKRPIICICNNLYAPALRPLRNVAHILRVTDTSVRKLVHRLNGICRRESLIVDTAAMTLLCDMAGSDVRTSLNTLQFLKRKTKHLTVQDIRKSGVGQKDSKLALRALWSSIFRKPSKRKRNIAAEKERGKTRGDSQMVDVDDLQAKVLRNIRCHGDYNFLVNGCMENYLTADYTDAKFHAIPSLLDWVGLYDTLNTTILTTQNYQLMGYMPYSVYAFHHHIAGFNELPQYNLPTQDRKHIQANSDCTLRELKAHKLVSASLDDLILDYTPSLLKILNPPFKNSRVEYLTANQKAIVENLVNCMVLYGLDFIPKRSETGQFVYELQPDLLGLSHYVGDGFGPGPELPDDIKKHVSNQASIERTRRIADAAFGREGVNAKAKSDFQGKTETDIIGQTGTSLNVKPKSPRSVLSIDQKLKDNSRTIPTKAVVRDFFGRIIEVNDDKEVDESDSNSLGSGTRKSKSTKSAAPGVWLTYNQGFTNAVKRPVKVTDLL